MGGAFHLGTDPTTSAKYSWWLVWGAFGVCSLVAIGCAICAVFGESGICVIFWLFDIAFFALKRAA